MITADDETNHRINPPANFALLQQLHEAANQLDPLRWVEDNFIVPYRMLRPESPGHPICQRYADFKHRKLTTTSFDETKLLLSHSPSIDDLVPARLDSLFNDEQHSSFCTAFESYFLEVTGPYSGTEAPDMDNVLVVGLELEGVWDIVEVDERMQTSIPNLYVGGDAAGIAQGVLQAMSSGLVMARDINDKASCNGIVDNAYSRTVPTNDMYQASPPLGVRQAVEGTFNDDRPRDNP